MKAANWRASHARWCVGLRSEALGCPSPDRSQHDGRGGSRRERSVTAPAGAVVIKHKASAVVMRLGPAVEASQGSPNAKPDTLMLTVRSKESGQGSGLAFKV